MRKILAAALFFQSVVSTAAPVNYEHFDEVMDNVSYQLVECSAYFEIVSGALKTPKYAEASSKYHTTSEQSFDMAVVAAESNRSKKVAESVSLARFKLSLQDMVKKIDNNYSNIAILDAEYRDDCIDAMKDVVALHKKWEEKIALKYKSNEK